MQPLEAIPDPEEGIDGVVSEGTLHGRHLPDVLLDHHHRLVEQLGELDREDHRSSL
jgi:hypothetical protein